MIKLIAKRIIMQTNVIAIPNIGLQGLIKEKTRTERRVSNETNMLYKKHSIYKELRLRSYP